MCDVNLVAHCLPGASIVEDLGDDRYKGKFSVKVGPMAASFLGEVSIERNVPEWTAAVTGKGADARSGSRATGGMTYRLSAVAVDRTRVDVECEFNLAGALAQFGKTAIIQEIANRITSEFVRNFEAVLAAAPVAVTATDGLSASSALAAESPRGARELDVGNLFWSIARDRASSFVRRLFLRRDDKQ
jgi:carbon-monoxide dehydrogenase small subunit